MRSLIILFLALFPVLGTGCRWGAGEGREKGSIQIDTATLNDHPWEQTLLVRTPGGLIWKVTERHPRGASMCDLTVVTEGLAQDDTFRFRDIDPVTQIIPADLDNDGVSELYVVTHAAGSGAYGTLYAFMPREKRRVVTASLPEELPRQEQYRGHDRIEVSDRYIVREYPLYTDEDPNCCPTGGKVICRYLPVWKDSNLVVFELEEKEYHPHEDDQ